MKNVYSPVRTYNEGGEFVVYNRQDFLTTENIAINWAVYDSGVLQKMELWILLLVQKALLVCQKKLQINW